VLTQLNSSSLPEEQLGLMRPLHQRGAKETKKQRLRRALKLQRAGLTDFEGAQELMQPRRVRGVGADGSGSDSSSSEAEDSEEEGGDEQANGTAAVNGVQQQQHGSGSETDGPESDGEEDGRPAKKAKVTAGAVGQQQQAALKEQQQDPAAAAAAQKAQVAALRAEAKALKAQARAEAAAEGTGASAGHIHHSMEMASMNIPSSCAVMLLLLSIAPTVATLDLRGLV
jgi:ATP-dependent RNA helicase DHX37/DHR1